MSKFLLACGGTGGHLAPGIALAETLQDRGHECILLISHKEVDSALISKYPHLEFVKMPGRAFSGGIRSLFSSLWSVLAALLFSRRLLKEQKPDLVLLFGGFISVGMGLPARLAGVPVALHEANCSPGRAIRLLKHFASRVYLPDGVRLKNVPPERVRHLGYPVRREIQHVWKAEAWTRLGIEVPNKLLVILGGSQGASVLNEWVLEHFDSLAEEGVSVYCVTGMHKLDNGTIRGKSADGNTATATFVPFSDNMGDVISAADLVVSRAGAGSIAEIIRCRAPAILIPYPYATDEHQMANARMHERHGAGMVLRQDEMDRLEAEVRTIMFNDWLLARFKANLARLDRFDAATRMADDLEELSVAASLMRAEEREAAT
ncbi:MAG: UDP-N-acetylglucosamine--N-acetylmuramyl-(pentapeptide) pyrophosphoryl-undecaprenol N-acetylglucosamine transferase [Opitutales bacterium]